MVRSHGIAVSACGSRARNRVFACLLDGERTLDLVTYPDSLMVGSSSDVVLDRSSEAVSVARHSYAEVGAASGVVNSADTFDQAQYRLFAGFGVPPRPISLAASTLMAAWPDAKWRHVLCSRPPDHACA